MPKAKLPEYNRDIFESWFARVYDITFFITSLGSERKLRQMILQHIPKNAKKILDMATGTAAIAIEIKKILPKAEVTAIDLSNTMLSISKRKAEKEKTEITFMQRNIEQTQFPDESFDTVSISFAMHEIPQHNRLNVIKEACRILKKDGTFVIMDMHKSKNKIFSLLLKMHMKIWEPDYAKTILDENLAEELRQNNFTDVKKKEYFSGAFQVVSGKKNINNSPISPSPFRISSSNPQEASP